MSSHERSSWLGVELDESRETVRQLRKDLGAANRAPKSEQRRFAWMETPRPCKQTIPCPARNAGGWNASNDLVARAEVLPGLREFREYSREFRRE
jgi:hypothetical protein